MLATLLITTVACIQPTLAQELDNDEVRDALEAAAHHLQLDQPQQALSALETVDTIEPENPWKWYFQGRANRRMGNAYAALEAYDRALDELAALGDPDPRLTERIRSDRRQVRRQVFDFSFQVGLAYDSNVTFRGGGVSDFIAGRDDGKFASVFRWAFSPVSTAKESFTMGGRAAHAWHFAIEQFNYQDYAAFFQYRRRLAEPWYFGIQYDYDLSYLGNESFLSNHALSPSLTYQWSPTSGRVVPDQFVLDYRIESRDFLFDTEPEFDRDGVAHSVGVLQSVRLRPIAEKAWTWNLLAGYRFESVATEGSEFDRFSNDFYLSLLVPLRNRLLDDKPLTARLHASWEIDNYRRRSLIDARSRPRDDLITTLGLVLSQQLLDDVDRGELILHAIVNWMDADSNVRTLDRSAPFTYDKVVAGVQLEWRF